jgi:hypothetical protein
MLKTLALALAATLAFVLIVAAATPDSFDLQHGTSIQASPAQAR